MVNRPSCYTVASFNQSINVTADSKVLAEMAATAKFGLPCISAAIT
jgi:hypothetical protein